jgi:Protein of unknown function (DUF1579)
MRKNILILVSLVFLMTAVLVTFSMAQQKDTAKKEKPAAGASQMSEAEKVEMEAWVKYGTPGAEHKRLEYFVGDWNYISKFWSKPEATPLVTNGTATQTMMFDGRYQQTVQHGSFMGQPFEGFGILGYDNLNKVYVLFWIDSMSTGFWEVRGAYDDASKTYTFKGLWDDPSMKTKTKVKLIYKIIDDNKFLYETYMIDSKGAEFKTMEITYTRKTQ